MLSHWLLAAVHLLAFGFALASIVGRAWCLRRSATPGVLQGVFIADAGWGLTALVLLITGVMRAFGGFEKGGAYYLHEPLFHVKMTALVLILLLEIAPMMTFIRWRAIVRRGGTPDLRPSGRFATISAIQMVLLLVMAVCASGMARGIAAA